MRRFQRLRRTSGENGVVAIVLALLTCFVVIPTAALAVDLGVQRVARTDMQSVADVVALDLARKLDGVKTVAQWSAASPSLQDLADDSLDRNRSSVGASASVVPTLGTLSATGDFTELPASSATVPTAVRVRASTSVDFALMSGSGGAVRTAVAQAESSGCFQLGSFAASLNPSASPLFGDLLSPLIGSSTLTMVGYQGLASARVSLLDLIHTDYIGVGTVDELLAMNDLTVAKIYRASAEVLRDQGQVAQANVFDAAAVSTVASTTVSAGSLFGLTTASDAALSSSFNALDLLVGTAFLADGDHLVGIGNLQTGLSSIGVTNTDLTIIERAQRACAKDEAKTAQVKLVSTAKLSVSNSPLYNVGGSSLRLIDPVTGSPNNEISLGLNVNIAGARGVLTNLSCNPDTFDVDVWTDLATVSLTGSTHIEGSIRVTIPLAGLPTVLDVPVKFDVSISSDASKPASVAAAHGTLTIPPATYADHVEVGSGNYVLPHVTVAVVPGSLQTGPVSVLGIPLSTSVLDNAVAPTVTQVLNTLTSRVAPFVDPFIDKVNGILGPLTTGLGLNVAGADVYGVPTPECQSPVLRG